jgi:hypothetical protein
MCGLGGSEFGECGIGAPETAKRVSSGASPKAADALVLTDEIIGPSEPIDTLAETLFNELERAFPSLDDRAWGDLDDGSREAYRVCLEKFIADWGLFQKVHLKMIS